MPVELIHFDGSAWRARGVARGAGASFAWSDRPTSARPPVDDGIPAGQHDRAARRGQGVRRDARRTARARCDLPGRLRLSRARVLPPAACGGHLDVPPRPPRRHRSARRRRPQGHHGASRLHGARARRPGRRARRDRLHVTGELSARLRPRRDARRSRPAHARRRDSGWFTSTRWASCSRCSRSRRARASCRSASRAATAVTASRRRALASPRARRPRPRARVRRGSLHRSPGR